MAVSPGAWWELGDDVVSMRGAVECTLAGDVLARKPATSPNSVVLRSGAMR